MLCLLGPTGVGKSDILFALLDERFEVISADAMQVYRGMDVGTAKPSAEERARLPHHLVDILAPSEQFSAGEFVRRAEAAIVDTRCRGRTPVLSGGTGYYVRSLVCGLPEAPRGEPAVRAKLLALQRSEGPACLRRLLESRDPEAARRISPNDSHRTLRALEVLETSGRSVYSFNWPRELRPDLELLMIGLERPREELYRRIEARVERMFERGLVDEIKSLLAAGYGPRDPGMRGIGYQEFMAMRSGCLALADVRELIKRDTRRYAKRQLTYLRAIPGVRWLRVDDLPSIRSAAEGFLGTRLGTGDPLDLGVVKRA